jgi:hypothetical protein
MSAEVVKRGIVKTIARSTLSQSLKEAKIKPHLSRYGLNPTLHKRRIHLMSTDEKTGIQALQHKYSSSR